MIRSLISTRTDDELRELLVPELADRITACEEGSVFSTDQLAREEMLTLCSFFRFAVYKSG
jgi:hypothetical protein